MGTIISSLYDYFADCPLLQDGVLNVDFLPAEKSEYTIDAITTNPVIMQYARGAARKQYLFSITSNNEFTGEIAQSISNSGFFEQLTDWINNKNKSRIFPILNSDKQPLKIETVSSGYLYGASEKMVRYQMTCRLIYFQK